MMFIFIDNFNNIQPEFNLALEDFAAQNLPNHRSYCLFYVNSPSVIVGKNQNVFEEININAAEKNNILIRRRISGGGAVYHDLGNVNFSFLTPFSLNDAANWKKIAAPVITALNKMGYPAQLNYRNDITLGGLKISGTAQHCGKNLMISHGTLLLQADVKMLKKVLTADSGNIQSKSLKSHRSSVLNLNEYAADNGLPQRSCEEFLCALREEICGKNAEKIVFGEKELAFIEKNIVEKYTSWAWNIGYSPDFLCRKSVILSGIKYEFDLKVKRGGIIEEITFFENFPEKRFFEACVNTLLEQSALEKQTEKFPEDIKSALLHSLLMNVQ
jgi:lipoate-protein ligase A